MCLYPKLIKNKKYEPNQKNGGLPPILDDVRKKWVAIGCEICTECRKQRANGWKVRLIEEIKIGENWKFITLTFNEEKLKYWTHLAKKEKDKNGESYTGYALDNKIATMAVRKFTEMWRKKYKKAPRHWFVTELGHNGTERLHLHGIIKLEANQTLEDVEERWGCGWVWKGKGKERKNYVNEKTIGYMVKYVHKIDKLHKGFKSKVLSSKGIGKKWIDSTKREECKFKGAETKEYYRMKNGYKLGLPIYYRNKIYSEEERGKLWVNRLEKRKAYVKGIEIDVSNERGWRIYYNELMFAREMDLKINNVSPNIIWKEKHHEESRREMNRNRVLAYAKKRSSTMGALPLNPREASALDDTRSAEKIPDWVESKTKPKTMAEISWEERSWAWDMS